MTRIILKMVEVPRIELGSRMCPKNPSTCVSWFIVPGWQGTSSTTHFFLQCEELGWVSINLLSPKVLMSSVARSLINPATYFLRRDLGSLQNRLFGISQWSNFYEDFRSTSTRKIFLPHPVENHFTPIFKYYFFAKNLPGLSDLKRRARGTLTVEEIVLALSSLTRRLPRSMAV